MRVGRGLIAAVTAGVLGLAGLAGCTSDDDWDDSLAAIVGDTQITEGEIDEVADDLRASIGAEIQAELDQLAADEDLSEQALADHEQRRHSELEQQISVNRTRALEMRILTEAGQRRAAQEGLTVPPPALEHHAHELGLDQDSRYVQLVGEFFAVMSVLQGAAGSTAPTEADQQEVYENLVSQGLTSASFAEAQEVLNEELLGQQVAIRDLIRDMLAQAETQVNPAYDLVYRVPVPVGTGESWLAVPLGGAD